MLYVRNLLSFTKRSNALQVAAASAIESNISDHITKKSEFDRLRAHAFRLRYYGSYTTVESIVYYLHTVLPIVSEHKPNLTIALSGTYQYPKLPTDPRQIYPA